MFRKPEGISNGSAVTEGTTICETDARYAEREKKAASVMDDEGEISFAVADDAEIVSKNFSCQFVVR